jgi:minor histocompatibility antigen H13|mmetsp:Transcript_22261/g.68836  ORF Transcript_22261/g.68836 Transcript_22261/m.68836 type:complete len:386 (-) Transcript_22261:51-1208(-)|eukprot:CAMPEP_0119163054 /NCGR_PEP_ID=MMETSP1315-20130426/3050_1 /TAXON_ID=676789 /ORGANISM="Prasinoderma singularis, Strain RCC927" /LENGTH=385 /DNA_ID=CAMNT_0007156037 /DNA_START=143 /DNA_END=1300 /DNA_ORIENTATION=+
MASAAAVEAKAATDWHGVLAHIALLLVTLAPALPPPLGTALPTSANIVLTASLAVYVGSYRSVKTKAGDKGDKGLDTSEMGVMEKGDALRFPLVGSCVLLSLFLAFKFLPKEWVNRVITVYFLVLGILALAGTLTPVVEPYLPAKWRDIPVGLTGRKIKIPLLMDEPEELACSVTELVAGLLASPMVIYYVMTKHWLANNALGLAFCVQGLEMLSIGSFKVSAILLAGLFVYDVFWVFGTPVMVDVAKNVDAPIKLLFPRLAAEGEPAFSMLGLGDIVIPGIVVALLLRFDAARGRHSPRNQTTFRAAFVGYVLGLALTIVVMNVFDAAQPALLYIVPGVMGATFCNALARGEFKELLEYDETPEDEDEDERDGKEASKEQKKEQ